LHANQRAEQHEQIRDIPPGNKALMVRTVVCIAWTLTFSVVVASLQRYEAFLSQVIRLPSANTVW
jgi:hypothetical protein